MLFTQSLLGFPQLLSVLVSPLPWLLPRSHPPSLTWMYPPTGHPGRCITTALSWCHFCSSQHWSLLCPRWHSGVTPTLVAQLVLWPQHLAIQAYFHFPLPLMPTSLHCTWQIAPFLSPDETQTWASALGYPGLARYLDTPLCPPRCPLWRHSFSCGCAMASISTARDSPAPFLLLYWAWPFLSPSDQATLCGHPQPPSLVATSSSRESRAICF